MKKGSLLFNPFHMVQYDSTDAYQLRMNFILYVHDYKYNKKYFPMIILYI